MEVVKRTVLAAVYAGVALPLSIISSASMLLDSDFSRCRVRRLSFSQLVIAHRYSLLQDKAVKAGVLLAEILEKRTQGNRPCILVSPSSALPPLRSIPSLPLQMFPVHSQPN